MLGYIKQTANYKLRLTADKPLTIKAYIDVSYVVHPNFNSHTGSIMTLGTGAVFARSVKQKISSSK